jgi:3-oxoacyl-[acyl-carrier-protein] synthase II
MNFKDRIVITGVGLTAPNGNNLESYRECLLSGKAKLTKKELRYIGDVIAGECDFDATTYQKKRDIRTGTRAGSIGIYCANEAIRAAKLNWGSTDTSRVGVYVGITEHGNVETENEIHNIKQFDYDTKYWSHHHNPRTVANNPAGEITLNLKITGPHLTLGAACAAGNIGLIHAAQMLLLNEVDIAIAGGVSESIHTFGIFAAFKSQGALAEHEDPNKASRPFDTARNGIVVSEGGCLYTVERLNDALKRGAPIIAEIAGWHINSDAKDTVLPDPTRQAQCMQAAIQKAGMTANAIHIVSSHATSTPQGDTQECTALREVFGKSDNTYINNTKSFIGHTMGAAGALELAGNLPSFTDGKIHPTINIDNMDPNCELPNIVANKALEAMQTDTILNNSFGMLGINSSLIIKKYKES